MSFSCPICGLNHIPKELSFGADRPDLVEQIPDEDRGWRVVANSDFAVLDDELYFVRGLITVPVHDHELPMLFGLWANLYAEDFAIVERARSSLGQVQQGSSLPARIANTLCCYPSLRNARTRVILQSDGRRPELLLVDENHPLFAHQRNGIFIGLALDLAAQILHPEWSRESTESTAQ